MDKVKVAYSDVPGDVAVQLLAAAERLDLDPGDSDVVGSTSDGHFLVPPEVATEAGLATVDDEGNSVEPEAPKKKGKKSKAKKSARPEAQTESTDDNGDEDAEDDDSPAGSEEVAVSDEIEALKGASLEDALKARGLPSKGRVADKKAAIAAYDAENGA